MANPGPYSVSYSFGGFQAGSPNSPLPGASVDNELANVAAATADLVAAIKDVRRSDGALNNGIVTFNSLHSSVQLTIDPTNGTLVAAAVAATQSNAALTAADRVASDASAAAALVQAQAAAASAATVNLSLYLAKSNNLAQLGSNDTALVNIGAAKADGTTLTGRLAPVTSYTVSDWNTVATNGWFAGNAAANAPSSSTAYWLVHCIAHVDTHYVTQIAYPFVLASGGTTSLVTPYRRHSYDVAGVRTWTPWESASPVGVGTTIWVNGTAAPAGYVKENGALLSRTTYSALYAYAAASGNIVTDASWLAGNSGAFSTGDLATTFRIPDARGEFIRGYDDSRGIDSGRVLGAHQADGIISHTHPVNGYVGSGYSAVNLGTAVNVPSTQVSTSATAQAGGLSETRPRNNAKLACIKF